jgi:hypothetical protein
VLLTSRGHLKDTTRYAPCCFGTELPNGLTPLGKQVYGKPGKDLNYDELVVYTDRAIRPAYLVMYELVTN